MSSSKLLDKLLKYPNVVGYSERIQPKIIEGKETDRTCLRIYVRRKVPLTELSPESVIPRAFEGYATDVVEVGELKSLPLLEKTDATERTQKYRPAFAGISCGHACITACTLGQPVVDREYGPGWLTNWHCAKSTCGQLGDDLLQPGVYDGGNPSTDFIGKVLRAKDVVREGQGVNRFDAAYIQATDLGIWSKEIARMTVGDRFVAKGEHVIKEGEKCFYTGRTSEFGDGPCIDESCTVRVNYGSFVAVFENQLMFAFTPNILPGNSGSPIYFQDKFGALAYAGSQTTAVGCKFEEIKKDYPLTVAVDGEVPGDFVLVYEDANCKLYRRIEVPPGSKVFEDEVDVLFRKSKATCYRFAPFTYSG